jgi:DNA-binding response OmpR family regulator
MSKYKILYAEDDETIAFLTKDHLESYYDVHHFPDGESALHAFPKGDFDLCILDIMMPKMDGFELAEAIRAKDQEVPILFLSAKTLKEDRIRGLKIGADDYLVKPFSIEELMRHRPSTPLVTINLMRPIIGYLMRRKPFR